MKHFLSENITMLFTVKQTHADPCINIEVNGNQGQLDQAVIYIGQLRSHDTNDIIGAVNCKLKVEQTGAETNVRIDKMVRF